MYVGHYTTTVETDSAARTDGGETDVQTGDGRIQGHAAHPTVDVSDDA